MLTHFTSPWSKQPNFALDWNGPTERKFVPVCDNDLSISIAERFEVVARANPARIAINDGIAQITYGEVLNSVLLLAKRIALQTSPDELVGIFLPTSANYLIAILACLTAGRMFVPLDLHYPHQWIRDVVDDSAMTAVIGQFDDVQLDALLPETVCKIHISRNQPSELDNVEPLIRSVNLDDPAFVLFTSGSTGRPKGIVNSQRNLLHRIAQYVNAAHINADDCFLPLSSECTIAGLRERMTALLIGATLHLIDVQRDGARQILNRLRDGKITIMYAVPALLRALMQMKAFKAPDSLRILRIGGEAVLWSDIERLNHWLSPDCRIELGYSSTEAPIMQWFVPKEFPQEGSHVPIGYPLAGNALAIVDEDGLSVPPGEIGELVVRSRFVALGHWRGGHCDSESFPSDPNDPSCRILRTGDLVRLRSDGLIDLIGRKDRQIKIHGQRVEPGEIEAALRNVDGVRDAAVFPRKVDKTWSLIAYIVAVDSGYDLMWKVKSELKLHLPLHLLPQGIHMIAAIPRLPSAKLDMRALEALDKDWQTQESRSLSRNDETPAGKTEKVVAEIWKRVLGQENIDRDADFFDLGGDSLMTLNLMFEIEDALGVELPVTMIFQAPTIASLAVAIESRAIPEFSPLVLIHTGGSNAPLFIAHGVGGNIMELFAAGRQIVYDGPVYGIQARGLDGRQEPNRTVADMADYYIASIRKLHPEGPYHLAGYSSGGLVAFEMACRLRAQGRQPASLTLIDTQTNARQWPLKEWIRFIVRRTGHHITIAAAKLSPGECLGYCMKAIGSFGGNLLWRFGIQVMQPMVPPMRVPSVLQKVFEVTLAAIAHYSPGYYDGTMTIVLAEEADPLMARPDRIWRGHAALLNLQTVPGNHRTMIQGANAHRVASILSALVK